MTMELSEGTQLSIAQQLRIPVEEVKEAVKAAMGDDLVALNHLWRTCYLAAVQGNTEAQVLTLRIAEFRNDVTQHYRTHRYPQDVEASTESPPAAIRTAWQILAGNSGHVAQTLVDIALHGENEGTRVTASIAILDRVGLGRVDRSEVAIHLLDAAAPPEGGGPVAAGDVVRKRLEAIHARKAIVVDQDEEKV